MTLQVGLVGRDGIVLASDRLLNIREAGDFTTTRSSKFFHDEDVACCWSGDETAKFAAYFIREVDWKISISRDRELRDCGDRAWKHVYGTSFVPKAQIAPRKVLVAFPSDVSLWELDLSSIPIVIPVKDKIVT